MTYNSQREHLEYPEYGRNIKRMVDALIKIEDKNERNKATQAVVKSMARTTGYKENGDYYQKVWDHLHLIANLKLDVDSPFPKPEPDVVKAQPTPLPYPNKKIKYKHYGRNIQNLIKEGIKMTAGEQKDAFVELLANIMKRSYLQWNRDSVSDDIIKKHLEEYSDGQLSLKESIQLVKSSDILAQINKKVQNTSGKNRKGKRRNRN